VSIRTPDQRLRVFVSSTLDELAAERRAVREAIESLRLTPVVFEQGARPHPPRALYRAYLEQSDVFIGLYWERYGWIAPGENVSGLEDEYTLAGSRPKLVYIKAPAERESRLDRLIARIQADDEVSFRRFVDADELRSLVADDLAVLLTERFAASASPSKEPTRRTGRIPRPLTRLIGREDDVTRVLELLDDPENRMLTLVGSGGIGKTRLALAVADRAKDRYPDGVAYVELAAVTEPSLMIPTIAGALKMEEGTGASLGIRLREALAARHMLIVLDNVEQLADAAPELADLLAGAPGIQLLVTSRRVLNVRGEHVYRVEPLPVPAADGEITPAVELFIDRAVAGRPDFRPTDDDIAAMGELARRLDGLPLAIELASARLAVLSPRAVLERMGEHSLGFLPAGTRDLPERQRTLRDTIAWSHASLTPDEQALFARLAVFAGSASLDAVEQVANHDGRLETLDVLASLIDTSLIRAVPEAAEPRFGMLETIREFAEERLEASEVADEYRARHETYYLDLAERGNIALGTADQVEWLDRLTRETDDLRAVLRRAVRRDDAVVGVRMGRALAFYWHMRGSYSEGRGWMKEVAASPSAGPLERAVAWTIGAFQATGEGDLGLLEADLDDSLRAANEANDRRTIAFAQLMRAIVLGSAADDDERWRAPLSDATASLDAEREPLLVGMCMLARSYLARVHGHLDEALDAAQAAHDHSVRIGEWYVRMMASAFLARTALELHDPAGARRHAIDSLVAAQRIRNVGFAGYALEHWATAELGEGHTERAARLFALTVRGYDQTRSHPWGPDAEIYRQLETDLRAALRDRYDGLVAEARQVDFDAAIDELATEAAGR
jgi:predicted ATPase